MSSQDSEAPFFVDDNPELRQSNIVRTELLDASPPSNKTDCTSMPLAERHLGQDQRIHTFVDKTALDLCHRVPVEIWQEIFLHHHSMYSRPSNPTKHQNHSQLPWGISQVCSTWRSAAHSLPSLWSHITDITLSNRALYNKSQCDWLTFLLNQSQPALLTLGVSAVHRNWTQHPFITLLSAHSERWESFSIHASSTTIRAFSSIENRLHSLRKLDLNIIALQSERRAAPPLSLFHNAPKLHSVCLEDSGMSYDTPGNRVALPWSQLTSYQEVTFFRGPNIQLSAAQNLQHLKLFWDQSERLNFGPIRLDNLRTLVVVIPFSWGDPNLHTDFIDGLTLPALHDLTFMGGDFKPGLSLLSFVRRSSACLASPSIIPLRKLNLRYDNTPPQPSNPFSLAMLFALTPLLEELKIWGLSDGQLRCLADPEIYVLPRLHTLVVRHGEADFELLNDIVQVRCPRAEPSLSSTITGLPRSLTTVRLLSSDSDKAHRAQVTLNKRCLPLATDSDDEDNGLGRHIQMLFSWQKVIIDGLDDYEFPRDSNRSHGLISGSQLNDALSHFENMDLSRPEMLNILMESQVPKLVHHLRDIIHEAVSPESELTYSLSSRIQGLLDSWAPELKTYSSKLYWIHEGLKSIVYLPPFDERRLLDSRRYLGDLSFGLPEYESEPSSTDALIQQLRKEGFWAHFFGG